MDNAGARPLALLDYQAEVGEVVRLQHALLRALPRIFNHDAGWVESAARHLAPELWREGVRAGR